MSELFSLFYVVIPFSVYHRLSSLHFRVNSLSAWTEKISHQLFRVVWKLIKSTAAGTLDSFFFLLNLQSLKHYLKILSSQIHICFLPQWFVYSVLCGGLVPTGTGAECPMLVWVPGPCQSRVKGLVSAQSAVKRDVSYLSFTPAGQVLSCLGYYLKERHRFLFWLLFKVFICHCIL